MTEENIVEDSARRKHAVRVSWFDHDPVGAIYVVLRGDSASKPIVEEGDGDGASPHN
jgi:hypothetical protein